MTFSIVIFFCQGENKYNITVHILSLKKFLCFKMRKSIWFDNSVEYFKLSQKHRNLMNVEKQACDTEYAPPKNRMVFLPSAFKPWF